MKKSKDSEWPSIFINNLKDLVKESPFIIFIFISPILLIIVLIFEEIYMDFFIIFFLYSIFGIVWRHFVKDIRGRLKDAFPGKFIKMNLFLTGIYQIINILAVIFLVILIIKMFIIK